MGRDYHDFVIKDGKFIGKFEEMYQKCEDPWEQSTDVDQSYSKMCSIASLSRLCPKKVLEIGCGLGHYTAFLQRLLPNVRFVGMDVSETAISKAKANYPEIPFICEDVKNLKKVLLSEPYDVIIFSEIMWYILDNINEVITELRRVFAGKYVLVNQTFYHGTQSYGNDYFSSPDEMIRYFNMPCMGAIIENENRGAVIPHIRFLE